MAVLKCTVCGGELEVNADMSVGVCKFCDSVITIPKEIDRKGKLYNRAVFLRQNNEFDKAENAYEDILKEDNSDAEAHWGLVLSKFGIEYVIDPRTQERIPTCHRTQKESVFSDPDYLAAVQYSDMAAGNVIEKEAKRIHEIQRKILEISQKEPPYDVFICYKESDEQGNRTEDSLLAQDLYYELIKKGYKVFFARKTLESKLGTEYEPIIFAALSSSKVMIVLGTRPEHFNSVWVRNEWSRFSKMSKDSHKVIIPAYRGMSPYELPAELSSLQSEDMSKLGFMQDLTDGIERCLRSERKETNVQKENSVVTSVSYSLERLLQNAQTYLKLDNYSSAEETYTTITKEYPEDHRGWWGLMVCKTRNFSEILSGRDTLHLWFRYVKQLASPEEYAKLEKEYLEYIYKLACSDAVEDIKYVNSIADKCNAEIEYTEEKILQADEDCKRDLRDTEKKITQLQEQSKWHEKKEYTPGVVIGIVGAGIEILSIYLLCTVNAFLGILLMFVGGGVLYCSGGKIGDGQSVIKRCNNTIQELEENKPRIKEKYETEKESLQENIPLLQSKLSECQEYLGLGEERIVSLWFEDECKKIEVYRPADKSVRKYRKKFFEKEDESDTILVECDVCGYEQETNADMAVDTCKCCGSAIMISQKEGVDVELTDVGLSEVKVTKVVRDITGLSLKEAKELVDNFPAKIIKGIPKEKAEKIKKQLEDVGANVRLI